jgi:hypothetical protein
MPEQRERALQPEHIAGLTAGGMPLAVMLSQGKTPDLSKVPSMSAAQLRRIARPGDILLSRGDQPYTGFRLMTEAITGAPYYHGDIVYKTPKGLRTTYAGAGKNTFSEVMSDRESAMLMRLKNMPRGKSQQIYEAAKKLSESEYAKARMPSIGLVQTLLPQSKILGKMPVVCKGEVCTTGPATVLRSAGIDPKLRSLPGFELAGDYLRSPAWKPVAQYGVRPSPYHRLVSALPARLAIAGGLGATAYQTTKDIREKEYAAPAAAVAGAGAGAYMGAKLDAEGLADKADIIAKYRKKFLAMGFSPERSKYMGRAVGSRVNNLILKYQLLPTAGSAALGGTAAYLLAKKLYQWARDRKKQGGS